MRLVLEAEDGTELTAMERPAQDFEALFETLGDMRFRDPWYPHQWDDHREALYEELVAVLNHFDHDPSIDTDDYPTRDSDSTDDSSQ